MRVRCLDIEMLQKRRGVYILVCLALYKENPGAGLEIPESWAVAVEVSGTTFLRNNGVKVVAGFG